jgi:hypothetical protein
MLSWKGCLLIWVCLLGASALAADLTDQQTIDAAYARLMAKRAAAARATTNPSAAEAAAGLRNAEPGHEEEAAAAADAQTLLAEHSVAVAVAAGDEIEQRKLRGTGSVTGACRLVGEDGAPQPVRGMKIFVVHKTLSAEDEAQALVVEAANLRSRGAEAGESDASKSRKRRVDDSLLIPPPADQGPSELRKEALLLEQGAKAMKGNADLRAVWQIYRKYAHDLSLADYIGNTVIAEGKTDVDGKYAMKNIPGGAYYVFASFDTTATPRQWIVPVIVDGNSAEINLSAGCAMPNSDTMKDALTDQQAKTAAGALANLAAAETAQERADDAARDARVTNDSSGLAGGGEIDQAKTIAAAITERRLVEGMTLPEAIKAARARPRLLHSTPDAKSYRWEIHARTGTHTVSTTDVFGREHFDEVVDYGIVDTTDATFVAGKLSSIDQGGDFSSFVIKQGELWEPGEGNFTRGNRSSP